MPPALTNGSALAAFLGGGAGAFAMGAIALANEAGWFVAPTLYGPAGGVSGRTTLAAVVWLVVWGFLHRRWRDRHVEPRGVYPAALVLTVLGIIGTFPPLWGLFS